METIRNVMLTLRTTALITSLSAGCASTKPETTEPVQSKPVAPSADQGKQSPQASKYIKLKGTVLAQSLSNHQELNETVRATATKALGLPVVSEEQFMAALSQITGAESSQDLAQLMVRVYRLPYKVARERFEGKGFPARVFTPAEAFLPKNDKAVDEKGLLQLVAMLKGHERIVRSLISAYDQGNYNKLLHSRGTERAAIMVATKAGEHILRKLQVNHLLIPEVRPMVASKNSHGDSRLTITMMGARSGRVYQRTGRDLEKGQMLQALTAEQATNWIGSTVGNRKVFVNPQYRTQQQKALAKQGEKAPATPATKVSEGKKPEATSATTPAVKAAPTASMAAVRPE